MTMFMGFLGVLIDNDYQLYFYFLVPKVIQSQLYQGEWIFVDFCGFFRSPLNAVISVHLDFLDELDTFPL